MKLLLCISFQFPLLLSPNLTRWLPFLTGRGADSQFLIAEIEIVLADWKVESELVVGAWQCLAKSQALLSNSTLHLPRQGSHQDSVCSGDPLLKPSAFDSWALLSARWFNWDAPPCLSSQNYYIFKLYIPLGSIYTSAISFGFLFHYWVNSFGNLKG